MASITDNSNRPRQNRPPTRRSDEIRQRRGTTVQKANQPPPIRRAQRATPQSPPPVMARRVTSHAVGQEKISGHTGFASFLSGVSRKSVSWREPGRQFNVVFPAGAEIRLPALPLVSLGWRIVSLILVIGLAGVLFFTWTGSDFQVKAAQVSGLQRITEQDVQDVLNVSDQPIFVVNPDQLKQDLKLAFPELSAIAVQVSLPDQVLVTVTERTPVLIWQQGEYTEMIDAQGYPFPLRQGMHIISGSLALVVANAEPPIADLPPITEEITNTMAAKVILQYKEKTGQRLLMPEMVAAILRMAEQVPTGTPILYDAQHGLGWKDGRGWDVYFGGPQDMDKKLIVYQAIVKRLENEGIQPAMISVEQVHAPYYRMQR